MGSAIIFLTLIFLLVGVIWYKAYAQKRAAQQSALIYVMEKMVAKDTELATDSLLTELRDIVIKRDNFVEDRFHKLLTESIVIDVEEPMTVETLLVCQTVGAA